MFGCEADVKLLVRFEPLNPTESSIDGGVGGHVDDSYFAANTGGGRGPRSSGRRRWTSYRGNEGQRSSAVMMSATDEDLDDDDDDDLGMTGEDEAER